MVGRRWMNMLCWSHAVRGGVRGVRTCTAQSAASHLVGASLSCPPGSLGESRHFQLRMCHQCMWAETAQKHSSPLEVQVEYTNGVTVPLHIAAEYLWNPHILSFRCLERIILFTSCYLSTFNLLKCLRFSNNILL